MGLEKDLQVEAYNENFKDMNPWRRRRKSAKHRLTVRVKEDIIPLKKKLLEKIKKHKKGNLVDNLTKRLSLVEKEEKRIYKELSIVEHRINTYSRKNR